MIFYVLSPPLDCSILENESPLLIICLPNTQYKDQHGDNSCFLLLFLDMPHGMWDLNFLTRDQTLAPCTGGLEF